MNKIFFLKWIEKRNGRLLYLLCLIAVLGVNVSCTLERPLIRPKTNLSKDKPVYYDFIARKYYSDEEYEKAIFQYQKILDKFSDRRLEYDKELAWTEYEMGFCYYKLGNTEKAVEYFERVLNYYQQPSAQILARAMRNKIQP